MISMDQGAAVAMFQKLSPLTAEPTRDAALRSLCAAL